MTVYAVKLWDGERETTFEIRAKTIGSALTRALNVMTRRWIADGQPSVIEAKVFDVPGTRTTPFVPTPGRHNREEQT